MTTTLRPDQLADLEILLDDHGVDTVLLALGQSLRRKGEFHMRRGRNSHAAALFKQAARVCKFARGQRAFEGAC